MIIKKLLALIFLVFGFSANAQVKIGDNPTVINPNAALEVESTVKGFLPPRMTTAQRNAIASPSLGLTIFNTTTNCLQWYVGNAWHDGCGYNNHYQQYPPNTNFCNGIPTVIVDVTNSFTGRTWMDRNLGANRVATSSTDTESYGSLFQWGRGADGHQCVNRYFGDGITTSNNAIVNTTVSTDMPPHGSFIPINTPNFDWRSPQNNSLWQGVSGTNNPCPSGYRLPTETELNNERLSWVQAPINSTNNAAGGFASPLKLPMAGSRFSNDGVLTNVGNNGNYWSSTVSGTVARRLNFGGGSAGFGGDNRASGFSVRCIKN